MFICVHEHVPAHACTRQDSRTHLSVSVRLRMLQHGQVERPRGRRRRWGLRGGAPRSLLGGQLPPGGPPARRGPRRQGLRGRVVVLLLVDPAEDVRGGAGGEGGGVRREGQRQEGQRRPRDETHQGAPAPWASTEAAQPHHAWNEREESTGARPDVSRSA